VKVKNVLLAVHERKVAKTALQEQAFIVLYCVTILPMTHFFANQNANKSIILSHRFSPDRLPK